MMASNNESITLTAHCLCKTHTFSTTVPVSRLPLSLHACHCDSCRHSTGALYTMCVRWPEPRQSVDVSELKVFHFGTTGHIVFCDTCSTPMFFVNPKDLDQELQVFTGTIANFDAGGKTLFKTVDHIFVGDTKDGGASMWMRTNADGTETKRYETRDKREEHEGYPFDWPATLSFTSYEAKTHDTVPIRCKCKGIDFVLHRPNYDNVPKSKIPWFIDPVTHKPLGGFCACNSCRLFGGIDIWNWMYTELKYISFSTSSNQPFPKSTLNLKALVDAKDPSIGTLKYYASSPDVQRYFCSTCSASIFYAVDDRPEIVDVSVGVLEASDGARAEGLLSWALGPIGRIEDSEGGWRYDMLTAASKEAEEWRISRGYPKNWRRVARERTETWAT
ncbi:hypothetical protein P280DRAFT_501105 [Massarina eburnea CBS 473.64]|uniref:CENP-V/GFA domain-containing protein n=1 Tax=Massarina eburnea CBS 473.64 TaxID=1395130 RepID=A0A6A6RS85_9PLEO|nr:hypothetical protein P280DRAFT_501105 [Massarina eburnea CBS 473.64]